MVSNISENGKLLTIIYAKFGPYHLARLNAIAKISQLFGIKVIGIEIASNQNRYPWVSIGADNGNLHTCFPGKTLEELSPMAKVRGIWRILEQLNPRFLAVSGHKKGWEITCLIWARWRRRKIIILMDSKYDDYPRWTLIEWIKRRIFSLYDAALVSGVKSKNYAEKLGIAPDKILLGSDVVDNAYFATRAEWVRDNAASLRLRHGLPGDYFLYVGRFDEKKNVSRLLQAYAQYVRVATVARAWPLVLCGSGPLEDRLRQEARDLGLAQVIFAGFKQIDELPLYYALARCLIMHSLGDTWGLVVNEAMAAGLPVLVSQACGCAPDLVQEGVNGYTFNPYETQELSQLMLRMSSGGIDLETMGEHSRRIIADFSPETFAWNLLRLIEVNRK